MDESAEDESLLVNSLFPSRNTEDEAALVDSLFGPGGIFDPDTNEGKNYDQQQNEINKAPNAANIANDSACIGSLPFSKSISMPLSKTMRNRLQFAENKGKLLHEQNCNDVSSSSLGEFLVPPLSCQLGPIPARVPMTATEQVQQEIGHHLPGAKAQTQSEITTGGGIFPFRSPSPLVPITPNRVLPSKFPSQAYSQQPTHTPELDGTRINEILELSQDLRRGTTNNNCKPSIADELVPIISLDSKNKSASAASELRRAKNNNEEVHDNIFSRPRAMVPPPPGLAPPPGFHNHPQKSIIFAPDSDHVSKNERISSIPLELMGLGEVAERDSTTSSLSTSTCMETDKSFLLFSHTNVANRSHDNTDQHNLNTSTTSRQDNFEIVIENLNRKSQSQNIQHQQHSHTPNTQLKPSKQLRRAPPGFVSKNQDTNPKINRNTEHRPNKSKKETKQRVKAKEVRKHEKAKTKKVIIESTVTKDLQKEVDKERSKGIEALPEPFPEYVACHVKTTISLVSQLVITAGILISWIFDCYDTMSPFLGQFFQLGGRLLKEGTKVIALLISFMALVGKRAFAEVIQNRDNVTIYYTLMYATPHFCSMMMNNFELPHFSPHVLSLVTVLSLSRWQNLISDISPSTKKSTFTQVEGDGYLLELNKSTDKEQKIKSDDEFSHEVCETVLMICRWSLPLMFIMGGISGENFCLMNLSNSGRLIVAYFFYLLQSKLILSPISWISWSIQILFDAYCPSGIMKDLMVFVAGLSTIRLARFLETTEEE